MTDLHRSRAATTKDLSTANQPAANAGAHGDIQHGIKTAASPESRFRKCGGIRIIVKYRDKTKFAADPIDK